jgi:hypothetical protein
MSDIDHSLDAVRCEYAARKNQAKQYENGLAGGNKFDVLTHSIPI